MTSWKCTRAACPDRLPIQAETAPRCYTCGEPMIQTWPQSFGMETGRVHRYAEGHHDWAFKLMAGQNAEIAKSIDWIQNRIAASMAAPE